MLVKINLNTLISTALIIILALGSCSENDMAVDHNLELSRYKWMVGNWNSTTDPAIWEFWDMDSTELHGVSMSIKRGDSNMLEEMKIYWKDTAFIFVADLTENEAPVEFILVKKEANRMRFRNPEHDFPKEISYRKIGHNSLRAEVGGDGKSVKYLFVKR